jgi:signal transduction histidine kinase
MSTAEDRSGRASLAPQTTTVEDLLEGDLRALDLLPDAVLLVDPQGAVRHVCERARTLLELDPGVAGKRLEDVLDLRDDNEEAVTGDLICAPGAVTDRLAERVLWLHVAGARRRPVAVTGTVLADGGALLSLRHAGRRERVDTARSDLVATVSHEIRSPLTTVKGFTRTMLNRWDLFSDEQKRQMLATINTDADRVTRLLTELLDVARIDVGRVQLDRRPVDVEPIAERVVAKAEHGAREREFTVVTDDDLPQVHADPDKVEQVLTNLVDNAVRHAPGSPVEVRIVQPRDGDVALRITVADRGPGIRPTDRRRIFGKFSRVDGDRRRAGSGLGLYITRGLVEAHGGRVWVDPDVEDGATFHVELPSDPSAPLDPSARGAPERPGPDR